jgi:isocitrate dehydrogenase kinase/phosphatase
MHPEDQVLDLLLQGFARYMEDFQAITALARSHFEARAWKEIQDLSRQRINLYRGQVGRLSRKVRRSLQSDFHDEALWKRLKARYSIAVRQHEAYEIAETFYNSVCRKVLGDIGADPEMMFVLQHPEARNFESEAPIYRVYWGNRNPRDIIRDILVDCEFGVPFEHLERDVTFILTRVQRDILSQFEPEASTRLEVLKAPFFRNKGAYLVGRVHIAGAVMPFVVPLLHGPGGIFADNLIVEPDELSIVFSFARSYFLVEHEIPSEVVRFLKSIMPRKPYGDLYNSIGFTKHGKTELYRDFVHHLAHSEDPMDFAPGIHGLVMAVFCLQSYPIVFKLIKDEFSPPKITDKAMVRSKYRMVSTHDRVGRMADTHEFEHFVFPKARFTPRLLEFLLEKAASIVKVQGDQVIIAHLYTERKMIPLNIFLETANPEDIDRVADEYANTIKQLAAANIFPGDMLLKNFGVTRHRRVIFYDYDEIGHLTDYHFREMPKAQTMEDIYADQPWFAVGEKDVFPEEFRHFLVGHPALEARFVDRHPELFDVQFWREMQARQRDGEVIDVFPYRRSQRFLKRQAIGRQAMGRQAIGRQAT